MDENCSNVDCLLISRDGKVLEKYVYDAAGNILEKTAFGKTTTYRYDAANQLVSSKDADGEVTEYAYDAAGRMVKEGGKTYRYGYLDKVLSVAAGNERRTFTYHVDGQLATATKGKETESFLWDGLALIRRGTVSYVNEPHPGGGAAVASSKDGVMFNDILGTTLGTESTDGYVPVEMSAFGDMGGSRSGTADALFTGKPAVGGLGYAFLFRNYRPGLGKWQTSDPLGYPDGWNRLTYGVNSPMIGIDVAGGRWFTDDFISYYFASDRERVYGDSFDTDCMGLTDDIFSTICDVVIPRVYEQINVKVANLVYKASGTYGSGGFFTSTSNVYDFKDVCYPLGYGTVMTHSQVWYSWSQEIRDDHIYRYFIWNATVRSIDYSDFFADPLNVGIELPGGQAYSYYHTWTNSIPLFGADWVMIE